jgi:hypothetical protein
VAQPDANEDVDANGHEVNSCFRFFAQDHECGIRQNNQSYKYEEVDEHKDEYAVLSIDCEISVCSSVMSHEDYLIPPPIHQGE